jgi:hypothetical protein
MSVRAFLSVATLAVAATALASCATDLGHPHSPAPANRASRISISVGPCFGFCPVYSVTIGSDRWITFSGERNTAVIGNRQRMADPKLFARVAANLEPFRPADGASDRVACSAAISDTSTYTITWITADGRRTVATHQSGCAGGPGKDLDDVLKALPAQLGLDGWARQVTRPGSSRG